MIWISNLTATLLYVLASMKILTFSNNGLYLPQWQREQDLYLGQAFISN